MTATADLVIVGAGPAGASAALGALSADPSLHVVLLDRSEFPRDKSCGDGIAPHVIDLLESIGVHGLLDDWTPVQRLQISRADRIVEGQMERATWVVPRTVFDARLVEAAQKAGAVLTQQRIRSVEQSVDRVQLDAGPPARLVVGADGAYSVVRRAVGAREAPMAVAIRGYAPTPPGRAGAQVIRFGTARQPSYAWSFDRGDGLVNVGYGELFGDSRPRPTRALLLEQLEDLLPGSTEGGTDWRGHQLPLSTWRPLRPAYGRVLLAGDAAGLVNPMTGEGIYHAVLTGLLAGQAAAASLAGDGGVTAGSRYVSAARKVLAAHQRHIAVAAQLSRAGWVLDAGIRASAADQRVFDDIVELGLARGRLTGAVVRALSGKAVRSLARRNPRRRNPPTNAGRTYGGD